jgi:hypothetical protein
VGWRGLAAILVTMLADVTLGWLIGGRDRELSRTLTAIVSLPNVGLAAAILNSVDAPQIFVSTIAAIFVVRVLVNLFMVQVIGRREQRPAPPFRFELPRRRAVRV